MATEPVRLTLQEYLSWELSQETRHEYVHGLVLAMTGASRAHGTILMNLSAFIQPKLRNSGCEAFASDMKLVLPKQTSCRYPDFLVTCDERDRVDPYVTKHPKLTVEVISPSTERVDRVEKLDEYATIPELDEYVLVYSQRVAVEIYRRGLDKTLSMIFRYGPGEDAFLSSLNFEIPVDAIYEGVDFAQVRQYEER
jgi:Uma2 family endonuclease